METEIDVKKITENDAKTAKTLTWIQVLTKDLTKKKKVMWLVKLVNYWEIAINTQSNKFDQICWIMKIHFIDYISVVSRHRYTGLGTQTMCPN